MPLTGKKERKHTDIPLENVQGHVELGLVGGGRAHQLALGVGRHDGPVGQGEAVDGAEGLAVAEHWLCGEGRWDFEFD